jgi:2-keto-4-pentenoate hydratase/2-oxohepta-3-ene-1,7-dioic acid hydratase in catechol pathway
MWQDIAYTTMFLKENFKSKEEVTGLKVKDVILSHQWKPFLATQDEIEDINNLKMWLTVNGKTFQNSNTDQLIFKIPTLVSYLSQFMTLLPGDIISTGTPPGVGLGFNPPIYLKEGDVVELGIENLGSSKQVAKNWSRN